VKRILIGFLFAGTCFLLRAEDARALANPGNEHTDEIAFDEKSCLAIKDRIEFPVPSITVNAEKTGPENPIAIGQDDDKRGVNIKVTITSLLGKAYYPNWVRTVLSAKAIPDGSWISEDMECTELPKTPDMLYCEWVKYDCKIIEEPIYRMLWPERTKVWLAPDDRTRAWLSWQKNPIGDPLRYVFPDDWGLGAWTPEGVKKTSNPGPGNEWWTFLYGDPTYVSIPAETILKYYEPIESSEDTTTGDKQVLGLFGGLSKDPGGFVFVDKGKMGEYCLIDEDHVKVEGANDKYKVTRGCKIDPEGASSDGKVTILTLTFTSIPLDLPGRWSIGITGYEYPAKYANNLVETTINGLDEYSPELKMGPYEIGFSPNNYEYSTESFSFDSYIVISTPCFNGDPKSCEN
jgi:hypothetical protein